MSGIAGRSGIGTDPKETEHLHPRDERTFT